MTSTQRKAVRGLVAVHLVLATAPLGAELLGDFIDLRMVPLKWVLSSTLIPFSQIMLLSIWVGMAATARKLPKILLAILATAFIAVWVTSGEVLGSTKPPISMVSLYFGHLAIMLGIFAVLSAVMVGTSLLVGTIRFTKDTDLPSAEPRFRNSLFALLVVSTATALVLGLVHMSRVESESNPFPAAAGMSLLLGMVVFALNMLTTIWATLGAGHVKRRLLAAFLISLILGISMSVGTGRSLFSELWWSFVSDSLSVVLLAAVMACTLLWIRRIGFRLVPARAKPESDKEGCAPR